MTFTKVILVATLPLLLTGCTGELIDGSQLFPKKTSPSGSSAISMPTVLDPTDKTSEEKLAEKLANTSTAPGQALAVPSASDQSLAHSKIESETKALDAEKTADIAAGLVRLFNGEEPSNLGGEPLYTYPTGRVWISQSPRGTVPKTLRNQPLVNALINDFASGYAPGGTTSGLIFKHTPSKTNITSSDLTSFVNETYNYFGVGSTDAGAPGAASASDQQDEVYNRVLRYLVVYTQGNFVDRQGNSLSAPKIDSGKLSDTAVTGALSVLIEAIADSSFRLPVFYKTVNGKKVWVLSNDEASSKEPTCAVLEPDLAVAIDDKDHPALLSEQDIRLMHYLVRTAGRQGEFLSGLLFRSIGKIDAGQFILAGVSIGDNQLLSTLVDTFFETGSRRLTEANLYSYLSTTIPTSRPAALQYLWSTIGSVYSAESVASN